MSNLGYMIRRLGGELGLSNVSSNPEQRARLLDIINQAAKDIYDSYDLPGCDREITVSVVADTEVALPCFIGTPVAMRANNYNYPVASPYLPTVIGITSLRPRYNQLVWANKWNKWRYKGVSPVQININGATSLVFSSVVGDTATVTVTGETVTAHNISETFSMSDGTYTTANAFTNIKSIVKSAVNSANITVCDISGNVLAVVLNDQLESSYQIYDISEYPNLTVDGVDRKIDVLYKEQLARLENDSDTFPVPGYYDVIIQKAFQLTLEWNKDQESIAHVTNLDSRIDQKVTKIVRNIEKGQEGVMNFEKHAFVSARDYYLSWDGSHTRIP